MHATPKQQSRGSRSGPSDSGAGAVSQAPGLLLGWLLGTESFLSIIYCVYSFSPLPVG